LKKLLKLAVAVAVPVLMAIPATHADAVPVPPDSAVVSIFTGTASVTPGLCAPGVPTCVGGAGASAAYNLNVPDPASTPLPAKCIAAGVFEGAPVVPTAAQIQGSGNCGLVANGTVTGTTTLAGPTCGLSHGESSGTNNLTLNGNTRDSTSGWVTSAGGTIPVLGTVDDAGGNPNHTLVALVQARPVGPAGTIACVTIPADKFIIVGVGLVA
jgi:hypothetical protein